MNGQDEDRSEDPRLQAFEVRLTADLRYFSDKASMLARTVNFGLMAVIWTLSTRSDHGLDLGTRMIGTWPIPEVFNVTLIAIVLALSLDFVQYLLGYGVSRKTMLDLHTGIIDGSGGLFDPTYWMYRVQRWCFRLKMVVTSLSTLFILACLFSLLTAT